MRYVITSNPGKIGQVTILLVQVWIHKQWLLFTNVWGEYITIVSLSTSK